MPADPISLAVAELAKKLAANPKTTAAAAALATEVGKKLARSGGSKYAQRRGQRALAELLAHQTTNAQISYDTVIGANKHTVVWVDSQPLAAFPEAEVDLAKALAAFDRARLEDPPPEMYKVWEPRWWVPPGAPMVWTSAWWSKQKRPADR